uniref:Beta/gamma crystallin 'Greek key' domain-containing protein n=1 Tax=Scleropages formosus TaxID=113540 RepID=A0A8C9V364_SCLFO
MFEQLECVPGGRSEDKAQVEQISGGNYFNRVLSIECSEGPISEFLSLPKDSTESNEQVHSVSISAKDMVLPKLDRAHEEKIKISTENSKLSNQVEHEKSVSIGPVGSKVENKIFCQEGKVTLSTVQPNINEDLNKVPEMPTLFTKSLESCEKLLVIHGPSGGDSISKSDESQKSHAGSVLDGLDGVSHLEQCGTGTLQDLREKLSVGDQSFILAEGHLTAVTEDGPDRECEDNTPQQARLGQMGDADGQAGPQDLDNPKCHALLSAPGTSNENGQLKSALKASNCVLLTESWQDLQIPRQGAGGSFQDSVNSRASRFGTQNRKVLPDLLPGASRSELSSHHPHRFLDTDMQEGVSGFAIISEEEEPDSVFINDTGVTLSPTSRRGKVYPFSLSPIYEEESAREEACVDERRDQLLMQEDLRSVEQQASSILSLLQSVSERLQSSTFSDSLQDSCEDYPTLLRRPSWDCYPDEEEWVGYTKEDYRGQQYLLEEGEYQDCRNLYGSDHALLSFRCLLGDFIDSSLSLREGSDLSNPKETEITNLEVPDMELMGPVKGPASICVRSGVWVAYSDRFFCGQQFVLEKGIYSGELDWGDSCRAAMSLRPVYLVSGICNLWLLFDEDSCGGNQFVLQEGNYPDLTSCGCMATSIKSLKPIPFCFSDPSISLFSLDSFEGLETIAVTAIEHLDNFFTQSLRVSSGLWVAYEYPNFKGRQMLLGPGSVSAWARHSGWDTVGSLHPLRQPKVYVRVWNRCLGSVLTAESGQGCSPPVKVSLSPPGSLDTQLWVFSGALLKCKATAMCLSVIGGRASPGARVALWPQHGRTNQKWSLNENGTISSHLDHNLVLDLKGKPHDFCIRVSLAFFV